MRWSIPGLFHSLRNSWYCVCVLPHKNMRSLLDDVKTGFEMTSSPGDNHGLWLVTTPIASKGLYVGDMLRVMFRTSSDIAWCYLMRRAKSPNWPVDILDVDTVAKQRRLFAWVPLSHMWVVNTPRAVPSVSEHSSMDPFLTKSPHLFPDGGWLPYLIGSGVKGSFKAPKSWQFRARGFDKKLIGKTGGLHMSENGNASRRCQLSVEYGIRDTSLMNTVPGTRAGVLMYLPNMYVRSNGEDGQDVCYDTSVTLSFSALLIVYAEAVSIVRKTVYSNPSHTYGGKHYDHIRWDFAHEPFSKRWVVSGRCGSKKSINLYEHASKKANTWIQAEIVSSPELWKASISSQVQLRIPQGGSVMVCTRVKNGMKWVHTSLLDDTTMTFTDRIQPNSLCNYNGQFFIF